MLMKRYRLTFEIKSYDGRRPLVRTLGGDITMIGKNLFVYMDGDMEARWRLVARPKVKRKRGVTNFLLG